MATARSRQAIIAILLIIGFYLLVDHIPPLPLNHEDIGLGKTHLAHAVVGLVLIAGALYIWRVSRTPSRPVTTAPRTSPQ